MEPAPSGRKTARSLDKASARTASGAPALASRGKTKAENDTLAKNRARAPKHGIGAVHRSKSHASPLAQGEPQTSYADLQTALTVYLKPAEILHVREAYRFSDSAHLGQFRKSGAPYITHPLAVAEICAGWRLDTQAIMAALLHDVMEDQGILKQELIERFGAPVAQLVDGLSKLDKLEVQSHLEAQSENFRKMLLAMSRDVRIILIKLADRLHNMRTIGFMETNKQRRIARETMDIFVPIAHRLGLNQLYRELQDLSFKHLYPMRYEVLAAALARARGNRQEAVEKSLEALRQALPQNGVKAEVFGREKTLYGIYRKMRQKNTRFEGINDVYGFRVVVETNSDCYLALGALHSLYKPIPGRFKDYIAIPKVNGYQSLHTTLIGPFAVPVEFQIRTHEMHRVAESGVAAHWLYKNAQSNLSHLQEKTHVWLQSLLDIQNQTGDSAEFLEHVKVDLFPDSVYVFTPKGKIMALPHGATALDFAYAVHTEIGNRCIAVRINKETMPLRTVIKSGDIVEAVTSPSSAPKATWLSFVRSGRARAEIRHFLRTEQQQESIELGKKLLQQACKTLGVQAQLQEAFVINKLSHELGFSDANQLFADIGMGQQVASIVARRLYALIHDGKTPQSTAVHDSALPIYGAQGLALQLASCCMPIPDDGIMAQVKKGQGLMVHADDCAFALRSRKKDGEHWLDVSWGSDITRLFNTRIAVTVSNQPGVLARVASMIAQAESNISSVDIDNETEMQLSIMHFVVEVVDRVHLARILRSIKNVPGVTRIARARN